MTAEPSVSEATSPLGDNASADSTLSEFVDLSSGHASSQGIAYDLAFFSAAPADGISAAIVALLKARDLYYRLCVCVCEREREREREREKENAFDTYQYL